MTHLPLIVAHRGASAHHRENSAASWRAAVAEGADLIEADTRITCDHRIVISHDADLQRVAGQPCVVADTPFAALQKVRAAGEPAAPPLADLFATVPQGQPLLYDIKDERPEALALLVEASLASGRGALTFGGHHLATLRRLRALGWQGPVLGLLRDMSEQEAFFDEGGTILRLWEAYALAHPELVRAHVAQGRAVWITTGEHAGRAVGDHDPDTLRDLLRLGISGVLVNDPAACRVILSAAAQEAAQ